jgi:transcriptional regulator with XRE-family HTH domain
MNTVTNPYNVSSLSETLGTDWKSYSIFGTNTGIREEQLYPLEVSRQVKNNKPHVAVQMVAPLLVLTVGTGGVMTPHGVEMLSRWAYTPYIQVEHSEKKNVDIRSPAEHVANIRDVFGVNMSDLAAMLGVTRPTVYAWIEGQEPKPEAVGRIQQLSRAADKFKPANIPRLDKLVHRPVLNGRSLLDMLKTDEDSSEAVALIKEIAEKEAQTRRESKGSGRHLRSLDDVIGDFSVAVNERS